MGARGAVLAAQTAAALAPAQAPPTRGVAGGGRWGTAPDRGAAAAQVDADAAPAAAFVQSGASAAKAAPAPELASEAGDGAPESAAGAAGARRARWGRR
mmetsp:Transcript_126540/g.404258  ORF Transcript_126540/g.404258 Transcript_126540/m.404258 type:complete len:99 (-) Transcript_126540:71-367(-)